MDIKEFPGQLEDVQIDELLDELNSAAQDVDWYEYGLPQYNRTKLYATVREWLKKYGQASHDL